MFLAISSVGALYSYVVVALFFSFDSPAFRWSTIYTELCTYAAYFLCRCFGSLVFECLFVLRCLLCVLCDIIMCVTNPFGRYFCWHTCRCHTNRARQPVVAGRTVAFRQQHDRYVSIYTLVLLNATAWSFSLFFFYLLAWWLPGRFQHLSAPLPPLAVDKKSQG